MPTSDLATFLESLGIEDVVDYGEEIGARCFKHKERTGYEENNPRHWFLNVATKKHHCFSCGYKGNLQSLVIDICDGDSWKAAGLLQGYIVEEMFRPFEQEQEEERLPAPLEIVQYPWPTERALKRRGLSMGSCKEFGVRWNPEESGWILPIRSPRAPHDLWGYQMKSADLVRNRPHKIRKGLTLFGVEKLVDEGPEIILVESPLDVVYLHEHGYVAVASFGDRVTPDQVNLLLKRTGRLILALDNDKAGIASMKEITRDWGSRFTGGMRVFNYTHVPNAKDPGEASPDQLARAINEADPVPFWEHHDVQRTTSRFSGRSGRTHDRAQSIARRLSAGTGKNRSLNRSGRTINRRG